MCICVLQYVNARTSLSRSTWGLVVRYVEGSRYPPSAAAHQALYPHEISCARTDTIAFSMVLGVRFVDVEQLDASVNEESISIQASKLRDSSILMG